MTPFFNVSFLFSVLPLSRWIFLEIGPHLSFLEHFILYFMIHLSSIPHKNPNQMHKKTMEQYLGGMVCTKKETSQSFCCQQYSSDTIVSLFPTRTASSTASPGYPKTSLHPLFYCSQWIPYMTKPTQPGLFAPLQQAIREDIPYLILLNINPVNPVLVEFWIFLLIIFFVWPHNILMIL